jgi:hypothetical protein
MNRAEAGSELGIRFGTVGHTDAWVLHECYMGVTNMLQRQGHGVTE